MKLNTSDWKEFVLGDLFVVSLSKGDLKVDEIEAGEIPLVSSGDTNNGVIGCISENGDGKAEMFNGNSLTLDMFGKCYYQPERFYAVSHGRVNVLEPKFKLNIYSGIFLSNIINREQYRFSYGRAVYSDVAKRMVIKLPIQKTADDVPIIDNKCCYSEKGYIPDWQFMEDYIKSLHCKPLTTTQVVGSSHSLKTSEWEEFLLEDIFELHGGFYNKKPEHSSDIGDIPFLASTENNNGVTEYYTKEDICRWDKIGGEDYTLNKKLFPGNCIAITVNGSVGNAFYQSCVFTCSHDITALYLRSQHLTPHIAQFLCTIIMHEKYRWSYGRKPHDISKLGKMAIRLPIIHNTDGTPFIDEKHQYSEEGYVPDWQFMEDYIKALPYGDRLVQSDMHDNNVNTQMHGNSSDVTGISFAESPSRNNGSTYGSIKNGGIRK